MLVKTKGIVLHHIKYSDSRLIAQIYTELHGRQSFLIRNPHGKKTSLTTGLLQPLFMIEMEAYHKTSREIQHLKELKPLIIFQSIPYDIRKSAVALFLGEILYRTLREEEPNPPLFEFLQNSIHYFDLIREKFLWFHLIFLVHYTRFLGFFPNNNYSRTRTYFDLREGSFTESPPAHPHHLQPDESRLLNDLLLSSLHKPFDPGRNGHFRKYMLEQLLTYYRLHIEGMGEIRSAQIMQELFH
ncbi:MAG TPA: DNA repair protein RecO [Bacteroidetes bacterium]|nr:DNA repair protein RecO [Bacteroidota bacterium]